MSTDEYVPSEDEMREAWREFTGPNRDHGFDAWFDAWLARVRREAALSIYAAAYRVGWLDGQNGSLPDPRMAYPEETP